MVPPPLGDGASSFLVQFVLALAVLASCLHCFFIFEKEKEKVTTYLGLHTLQHLEVAWVPATATHMRGAISRTEFVDVPILPLVASTSFLDVYQRDREEEKWDVKTRILSRRVPDEKTELGTSPRSQP